MSTQPASFVLIWDNYPERVEDTHKYYARVIKRTIARETLYWFMTGVKV